MCQKYISQKKMYKFIIFHLGNDAEIVTSLKTDWSKIHNKKYERYEIIVQTFSFQDENGG
jgi:hypothetical protein